MGFETANDNYTYFLNLKTCESVFLGDELITGLDNEGLEGEIWQTNWNIRIIHSVLLYFTCVKDISC